MTCSQIALAQTDRSLYVLLRESGLAASHGHREPERVREMLQFHRTSLMTSSAQTVVNTVNTVGVMGKGIAAAFKERYPKMFLEYKRLCADGLLKPGSFWLWKGSDQWVLNFSTKKSWRNPSKIEYIREGLIEFRETYAELGIREVAFPRLGCGNGGLDWGVVRPLMIEMLRDLPISVYIHDFENEIDRLEHELPLLRTPRKPDTFEGFYEDLRAAIEQRKGKIPVIMKSTPVCIEMNEVCELREVDRCNRLIASEEDLYRIWTALSAGSVSRFDFPDDIQDFALKLLSLISQLPYVRPVTMADLKGRVTLAVECVRGSEPEPVSVRVT